MHRSTAAWLSLAFFLVPSFAAAQNANLAPRNARNELMQTFEQTAPAVGVKLPNIPLFDATGHKFGLHELQGHYTVLVFGCLT